MWALACIVGLGLGELNKKSQDHNSRIINMTVNTRYHTVFISGRNLLRCSVLSAKDEIIALWLLSLHVNRSFSVTTEQTPSADED